jgi:hypothetical protein
MPRHRRVVGWAALLAVVLVLPSIAAADRLVVAPTTSRPVPTEAVAGGPPSAPPAAATLSLDPALAADDRRPVIRSLHGGLLPGSINVTSIDLTAEYDATVHLDFGTRAFRVDSTMIVTNTSDREIDRLELNTIAARLGRMTITSATVEGKAVSPTVSDQTIHLPLGGRLGLGQQVAVRIGYRATLRSDTSGSDWLFTRTNGILEAYRWLPWISRPVAFDRPNHGDPFVTPVSPRVRVTIVSDRALTFATTGEPVAASGLTKTFLATNVRDFAFTAAPDYAVSSATVGTVTVRVFGRPGFPRAATLAAAKTALTRESALVGGYPYPTYDLAQIAGGYGMESPGLTWIPSGVASANLAYLVAHETGHQWFYGIVGSDQSSQPFADEAATDFLARYALGLRRASRCSTARLDLSIYRYSSACYYEVVYIQGGNFLDDTRKAMGSTAFWAGLRDYIGTNRFKLTTTKTLLDTLDAHTPLNLVPRYAPRFPSLY